MADLPEEAVDWNWIGTASSGDLIAYLQRPCSNSNWELRREAVRVLGERRSPEAFPLLVALLTGDDGIESDLAAEALAQLGNPAAIPHLERMYTEALQYLAKTPRLHFGEMRPTVMLTALMWLRCRDDVVRLLCGAENPHERVLAALELGRRGDPDAIEALRQAQSDPNEYVRSAAREALGQLLSRRHAELVAAPDPAT